MFVWIDFLGLPDISLDGQSFERNAVKLEVKELTGWLAIFRLIRINRH